jgi:hypothetical protein
MNMPSYGFTPAVQFTSTLQRWCSDIIDRDRVDQKTLAVARDGERISPGPFNATFRQPLGSADLKTGAIHPYRSGHEPAFPVKNFFTVSTPVWLRTACRS